LNIIQDKKINIYSKNNGSITADPVYSQGMCEYIIHPKEGYLECRHTSWAAKKGLSILSDALDVDFEDVYLDNTAMKEICDEAEEITYVALGDLGDTEDMSRFQLSGKNVLSTSYWKMYNREGRSRIKAIKGRIGLATGGEVNVRISNKGSMLFYKSGQKDYIDVSDIAALNKKILDLVNGS
jgi:hypothetical protein